MAGRVVEERENRPQAGGGVLGHRPTLERLTERQGSNVAGIVA